MTVEEEETGAGWLARRRTRSRHPPTLSVTTDSRMGPMSETPATTPQSLAGLSIEDLLEEIVGEI